MKRYILITTIQISHRCPVTNLIIQTKDPIPANPIIHRYRYPVLTLIKINYQILIINNQSSIINHQSIKIK